MLAVALAGSLHWGLYYPYEGGLPSCNFPPNPETPNSTQENAASPQNGETRPIAKNRIPKVPTANSTPCIPDNERTKSANERGLLLFTGVLAVATIALMTATVGLVFLSDRQIKDARLVQRAHVFVKVPESAWVVINGVPHLRVWVVWRNSGATPASNMRGRIVAQFALNEAELNFAIAQELEDSYALGPGNEIQSGTVDINQVHVAAAANGMGHQFVWGYARYKDVYPDSPEHFVEYCFKLSIEGNPIPGQCLVRFNTYGPGGHNQYYDRPA